MSRHSRKRAQRTTAPFWSDRVTVVDIAADQPIWYLSSEYLNTRARPNLVFHALGKAWKILQITSDERILALPVETNEVFGLHGDESSKSTLSLGQSISFESYRDYLIVRTPFATPVARTLSLVFDVFLTEQDLVRDVYTEDSRILILTSALLTKDEMDSICRDLSHINDLEVDRLLGDAVEARFPVVEEFRTENPDLERIRQTVREEFVSKLKPAAVKRIYREIARGSVKFQTRISGRVASPSSSLSVKNYTREAEDDLNNIIVANSPRLKKATESRIVELLCLSCLSTQPRARIVELAEKPSCIKCSSRLLALVELKDEGIPAILGKKRAGVHLNFIENRKLSQIRRSADLILSYGKRAVISLNITGIGPQTASIILARMHNEEAPFYNDLLAAKIHFLTTRDFWKDQNRQRSLA